MDVATGANDLNTQDKPYGLWLRVHKNVSKATDDADHRGLSPRDMGIIDQKFDDGKPGTGIIRSAGAGNNSECDGTTVTSSYKISDATVGCVMLYLTGN
jgi:hypothetical protein